MIKKLGGIFVITLFLFCALSVVVNAGDPENPEVIDKKRDVRLFWFFPFPFQMQYKYADIVAAWLHEDSLTPEYLFVSLQLRDLVEKTESLEAIYTVSWAWNMGSYIVLLHIHPDGISDFWVGRSLDWNDDIDEWIACDGVVDSEQNSITWSVPKEFIGNPPKGATISNILPVTTLRFTDESGLPQMDVLKDTGWNAKTTKKYVIQY